MFTKRFTKIAAAFVFSLFMLVSAASAQDYNPIIDIQINCCGGEDWKEWHENVDWKQIVDQSMQDPQIQAAYNQCVRQGYMCGDLYQFAINYVATNGFNDNGASKGQKEANNREQTATVNAILTDLMADSSHDPKVSFAYQQFVERSGCTSRQQFAYVYGATAGFTNAGIEAFWNQLLFSDWGATEVDWQSVIQDTEYGSDGSMIETYPTGVIFLVDDLNLKSGEIKYDPVSELYFQYKSSAGGLFSCDATNFVSLYLILPMQ
jgi:hypothetical protein